MGISQKDLTVVIVTFQSEKVIIDCINSIDKNLPIIVVENSSNHNFKRQLEKRFTNVECILTNDNLGMGRGNNVGIRYASSNFVMIINPDTILYRDTISELINISKKIDFSILSPISDDKNYPNYKGVNSEENDLMDVDHVDGYSMLLNKSKFNNQYFDEEIFMFLENNDLCKRMKARKEKIFISKNAKIKHYGGKSVDFKKDLEIEILRNWHWMWSKFYFNKKYYGYIFSSLVFLPSLISSMFKFFLYKFLGNQKKKLIYKMRFLGLINSYLLNSSFYRPYKKKN